MTDADVAGLVGILTPPPNGFADASPRHNEAMKRAADALQSQAAQLASKYAEIARLEAECFRLAASQCIKPGTHGLRMGEGGHIYCSAFEALTQQGGDDGQG